MYDAPPPRRRPALRGSLVPALFALTLSTLLPASPSHAQLFGSGRSAALEVRVVSEETGEPIADARLELSGGHRVVFTDRQGRATLGGIVAGRHLLLVTAMGLADERVMIEFAPGARVDAEIGMIPQPIALEGVAVTARRRVAALDHEGFYERRRVGFGSFLDRDQIERLRPIDSIDLFRQVRGFNVTVTRDGRPLLITTRGQNGLRTEPCIPEYWVDGMKLHRMDGPGMDPFHLPPPQDLEAIEAYAGPASIPPRFNTTGSSCGVVALWTRRGR